MPDTLPPVDKSVVLPPAIQQQIDAAAAAHAAAYPAAVDPNAAQPDPKTPAEPDALVQLAEPQPEPKPQPKPIAGITDPALQPQPQPKPKPKPAAAPVPETGDTGSWENRFHSMKGRFDQSQTTLGGMQEQLAEMGDELMRVNQALQLARRGGATEQPRALTALPTPQKYVKDDDVQTYGPELLDFVTRAARDAIAPDLQQVTQQVRNTSQRVTQTAQSGLYATLDAEVPTWREINTSQRFKAWCRSPDVYSGVLRGKLLNDAFNAANAPRVAAFFQGFLDEEQATGQLTAPQQEPQAQPVPRQAAVPLESLAAPGRAKPASGDNAATAAEKPVFTRLQVSAFYTAVRQGHYNGRDADKARDEAAIFAAQKDGRIR